MKSLLLYVTCVLFTLQNPFNLNVDNSSTLKTEFNNQDKTHLIKKTKAKINALTKKRNKLKTLKKWSEIKEKTYQKQIKKLNKNLQKLGDTSIKSLDVDEVIKKLQKELKYLNNKRVNKNAVETFSIKDDSIYKIKAAVLIDSIIKLRMSKS